MNLQLGLRIISLFVLLTFTVACHAVRLEKEPRHSAFVRPHGTELRLGGRPYRNIGANMPDLFVRFLLNEDVVAEQSLGNAQRAGIRFVRCFGATWKTQYFDIFEKDRARWLSAYDRMLAAADRRGIKVVPSLMFNSGMIPKYIREKTGRNDENIVDFLTVGTPSNQLAMEYVTAIVSRYKDDSRILFWEIGNEYNLMADLSKSWWVERLKRAPMPDEIPTSEHVRSFLVQIATLIKQLDRNHLVTAGHGEMRPYAWHIRQAMLAQQDESDPTDWVMDWRADTYAQYVEITRVFNPPPLDVISIHHYPMGHVKPLWLPIDDSRDLMLQWSRMAADEIGKPLFVGEFGQSVFIDGTEQSAPLTSDVIRQVRDEVVPIAAVWTWEFASADDPVGQGELSLSFEKTPVLAGRIANANRFPTALYVAPDGAASAPGTRKEPRSLASVICANCAAGMIWLLPGVYPGDKTISASGITLRSAPGTRAKFDGGITIAAPDVTIDGLEIFDSSWTDRLKPTAAQNARYVNVTARRARIVNSYIHDLAGGILAFNGSGGATADLLVDRNLIYNIGWPFFDFVENRWWGHGHAVYTQNDSIGIKTFANNVFANQFKHGMNAYGTSKAHVERLRLYRNVQINNRWLTGGLSGMTIRDVQINDNRLWRSSLEAGYLGRANEDVMIQGNWIGQDKIQVSAILKPTIRLNRSAKSEGTNVTLVPPQGEGVWDENSYWHPRGFSFEINGLGFFNFGDWQSKTGWDRKSVLTPSMPAENWIDAWPSAPHYGVAVIYNWTNAPTVAVDLAPLALTAGKPYELVNIQNPSESMKFVAGKAVDVPMSGWTVVAPYAMGSPQRTNTFPHFGAFLIEPLQQERRTAISDLAPVPDPRPAYGLCQRDTSGKLVITVRNQGTTASPPSTTTVEFSPGGTMTIATPFLGAGASVNLAGLRIPPTCFSADCSFKVIVDSAGQVRESNEANNVASGRCLG